MGYDIKQFNPTVKKFTYCLTSHDCYELRSGICSLYLSEEEAELISEKEGDVYGDGNVMSCRTLAKTLLDIKYYDDPSFQDALFSIRMHPRDCGHYVFTDGQHRTCIAKHLNIQSMYAKVENYKVDYEINCIACHEKLAEEKENTKLVNRMRTLLNPNKKKKTRSIFLDEEYMKFKKDFHVKSFKDKE